MNTIGIIPARLASTRFPRKPLAKILGRPMIEHVFRRAEQAKLINDLYIATCDREIALAAESFGCKAIMTSDAHVRGTDRVAEAAEKIEADIILNIQGDEPLLDPESLDAAISVMINNKNVHCMNLISTIKDWKFFIDPNVIKTVIDENNKVLYFSRQPIPTVSQDEFKAAFKQIGIYIFRKEFLLKFSRWQETPLEKIEKIDMLRILERGFSVEAFHAKDMISVDTTVDLALAEQMLLKDPLTPQIFKQGVGLNK